MEQCDGDCSKLVFVLSVFLLFRLCIFILLMLLFNFVSYVFLLFVYAFLLPVPVAARSKT